MLLLNKLLCSVFPITACYHDQNSMAERAGGLKRLFAVVVLVLPLHAFLYHGARLWILVFPVHKEES